MKGTYNGPKKVKASGKAAGSKKKKVEKKTGDKKAAAKRKPTAKPKANAPLASADGLAPLKKRKPAAE
ncbi:hypothetical protein D3C80_1163970 [compost metagenome]